MGCNCGNRVRTVGITPPCNCRNKANYLLEGKCCKSSIIFKATLKSNGIARHYYGCSETEFKTRFNNHKQSLVHRRKRNATELSRAVWNAEDAETNPSIKWSIAAKTSPYQPGAKTCNLWLAEKLAILQSNPATTLNKRSELNSKCRIKTSSKWKVLLRSIAYRKWRNAWCGFDLVASFSRFRKRFQWAFTSSYTFSCNFFTSSLTAGF